MTENTIPYTEWIEENMPELADEIDDPLIEKIGDCRSPRNLMTAIQNGHAIADAL